MPVCPPARLPACLPAADPAAAAHIDKMPGSGTPWPKGSNAAPFFKGFADMYMLGQAQCLVASNGYFARLAAQLQAVPPHLGHVYDAECREAAASWKAHLEVATASAAAAAP